MTTTTFILLVCAVVITIAQAAGIVRNMDIARVIVFALVIFAMMTAQAYDETTPEFFRCWKKEMKKCVERVDEKTRYDAEQRCDGKAAVICAERGMK